MIADDPRPVDWPSPDMDLAEAITLLRDVPTDIHYWSNGTVEMAFRVFLDSSPSEKDYLSIMAGVPLTSEMERLRGLKWPSP